MENTKTCQHCKEDKPLDQFSKSSRMKDGLQPACRACNKINNAKFRKRRPKYQKKYYDTPEGKANKIAAVARAWDREGAGIYVVKNTVTGTLYVGQTTQLARRRMEWNSWTQNRDERHLNRYIIEDIDKYGTDVFEFTVIEHLEKPQKKTLLKREYFWIKAFAKVTDMYNIDVYRRKKTPRD